VAPKKLAKKDIKRRANEGSQSDDTGEADGKLEAQREYNRVSAARARKRQKDRIADLEEKVKDASYDVKEHQKTNNVLQAQVDMLVKQNQLLLAERCQAPPAPVQPLARACVPALERLAALPIDQLLLFAERRQAPAQPPAQASVPALEGLAALPIDQLLLLAERRQAPPAPVQPPAQASVPALEGLAALPIDQLLQIVGAIQMLQTQR
jgi:hypothetical protein